MRCLRCPDEALVDDVGSLGEAVCRRCHGRFLAAPATERLFVDVLGVGRALLEDAVRGYPGRARCPACDRRMSIPPVRGVAVDVCGGCGGCFLDAGELARLSGGRFVELHPGAAELAPSTSVAVPALLPTVDGVFDTAAHRAGAGPVVDADRGWAVFVVDAAPPVGRVVHAYASAAFRTAIDARIAAARAAGGVVVDELAADDARRLAAGLVDSGVAAQAIPRAQLALPHVVRARKIDVDGEDVVVPDALGRPQRYALRDVRLLAAARTRIVEPRRPGPREGAGGAAGAGPAAIASRAVSAIVPGIAALSSRVRRQAAFAAATTELREVEESFIDVVLVDVRLRFDATGVLGRDGGRQTLHALAERLDVVVPREIPRHRGFAAIARGAPVVDVRSLRDLDREESWALWSALQRASSTTR